MPSEKGRGRALGAGARKGIGDGIRKGESADRHAQRAGQCGDAKKKKTAAIEEAT